jgi:hypothetical protein
MIIYRHDSGFDGFEWINTIDGSDYEVFYSFDGSLLASSWKPVAVKRVRMDEQSEFKASDFPWLGGHIIIMRGRARLALNDFWMNNGELLPLSTTDGVKLCVLNVTKVLNVLDEEKSEIIKFKVQKKSCALSVTSSDVK